MALGIARPQSHEDINAVRKLIRDVFAWAIGHLAEGKKDPDPSVFANLEIELAGLPGRFGPPSGCLLLARLDGAPAGCVVSYGQDAETMKIKRVFVRPEASGKRVGARMLEVLLAKAGAAGYVRFRLSTPHKLHTAQALYRRAGFLEVPGSADFPGIGVDICMEMIPAQADSKEPPLA